VVGVAAAGAFGFGAANSPTTVVGQASPAWMQPAASGDGPSGGFGFHGYGGSTGYGSSGGSPVSSADSATSAQEIGVVDIDTVLQYQNSAAAGTGMILSSSGEVLTNNHVVDGATSIKVTVVSTGAVYTATVVGTDPTQDVAVLQLQGASALQTVAIGTAAATVGESVTAVGNAGGTGGTPAAAPGTVTALDQSITASDETGTSAEQLSGLIQVAADVQAGDSGGPLFDASGAVIGMDTAASGGGAVVGYAIPIATAVSVADEIESGTDSPTIHQGYPAFLGVSAQDGGTGALISGVVAGKPAEGAGLVAGDVITALDGRSITSAADLSTALAGYDPGQQVTVTWTDASGVSSSAAITLGTGPAD